MELDKSRQILGNQSTDTAEVAPWTPEERLSRVISGIKKDYEGIPSDSPQAEALKHITTLTGLFVRRSGIGTGILGAIIARRKEDDEVYRHALNKLDGLTAAYLGDDKGDKLMASATALDNQLHALVAELYPRHAQRIAL